MKSKTNTNAIEIESDEIYTRHLQGTHAPIRHNPNCPIVYHHQMDMGLEEDSRHFASIIAATPGEDLFEKYRASIEVRSNGPSLFFTNGLFGPFSPEGSILVPKLQFPALTANLYTAWVPNPDDDDYDRDDPEDYLANYSEGGRAVYFSLRGEDGPCEALQLLQHWNHFEDRGLSWKERDHAHNHGLAGISLVEALQDECELLGLEFGKKNPYEKQLNALDACLALLEVEHWKRIREIAAAALKHAEKSA